MATFFIKHVTKYTYSDTVIDGATLTRLHPINDDFQKVTSHLITITNNPLIQTHIDYFKNRVGTFMITEPHNKLTISSELEITTAARLLPEDNIKITEQWQQLSTIKNTIEFFDFTKPKKNSSNQDIEDIILDKHLKTKTPYKAVLELCEYIHNNFEYKSGITNVDTNLEDVWKLKAGVCQDFTMVLLQMVRKLGVPARYVSGYICPNDDIIRGFGATHAWVEAYIPFYGWLGIDPTNNTIANEHHVRISVGRNYNDCSPVKGVFKGVVEAEMGVKVEVKTSKNKISQEMELNIIPVHPNNSYKRNLHIKQQQSSEQNQ